MNTKTVLTLYGDWGERTNKASKVLGAADIPFRVHTTHDYDGIPVLSLPFGEIYGLERIRDFAERWLENKHEGEF